MSIKVTEFKDTGIYSSAKISVDRDKASQLEYMEEFCKGQNADNQLAHAEEKALAVLAPYKSKMMIDIDSKTGEVKYELRSATVWPHAVPDDAPMQAQDAHNVMMLLCGLRHQRKSKNVDGCIIDAIRLGRTLERMGVRPFEEFAMTGRKVKLGGRDGSARRYGTLEARQERRAKYQAEINRLMNKNKTLSYSAACKYVANQFKISDKTVQRHTSNPRKKS